MKPSPRTTDHHNNNNNNNNNNNHKTRLHPVHLTGDTQPETRQHGHNTGHTDWSTASDGQGAGLTVGLSPREPPQLQ